MGRFVRYMRADGVDMGWLGLGSWRVAMLAAPWRHALPRDA
jgi:hypothetical protein